MSFLTRIMLEAERDSALDFMQAVSRDKGLQAVLREEGLRAAMRAAARQADSRRWGPVRQEPEPGGAGPSRAGSSDLRVNSSGRIDRPANRPASRPNGPGEAGPVRTSPGVFGGASPTRAGSSTPIAVGEPVSNNSAGHPSVHVIGRSPQPSKPVQSVKSRIVPEPDQIQSKPPGRRFSPLEPPGS